MDYTDQSPEAKTPSSRSPVDRQPKLLDRVRAGREVGVEGRSVSDRVCPWPARTLACPQDMHGVARESSDARYHRLGDGVERVTGRPTMSVREFVSHHARARRKSVSSREKV